MIRKFIAPLVAALAIGAAAASPAQASPGSLAKQAAKQDCRFQFPNTCRNVRRVGLILCCTSGYHTYHYRYDGYFGSRKVTCEATIMSNGNNAYVTNRPCWYV